MAGPAKRARGVALEAVVTTEAISRLGCVNGMVVRADGTTARVRCRDSAAPERAAGSGRATVTPNRSMRSPCPDQHAAQSQAAHIRSCSRRTAIVAMHDLQELQAEVKFQELRRSRLHLRPASLPVTAAERLAALHERVRQRAGR